LEKGKLWLRYRQPQHALDLAPFVGFRGRKLLPGANLSIAYPAAKTCGSSAEARHYRHTFRHRLLRTTTTRENSIAKSKRVLVPQRADQPAGIDRGRREPIPPGPLIGRLASADAALKSRGNVFQRQRIGLPSAVFERSVVPEADDSAMECSLERRHSPSDHWWDRAIRARRPPLQPSGLDTLARAPGNRPRGMKPRGT
jgi:hypothetical protein